MVRIPAPHFRGVTAAVELNVPFYKIYQHEANGNCAWAGFVLTAHSALPRIKKGDSILIPV